MRRTSLLWLCLLFCFFAGLAQADNVPVDPQMQVDDPTCPESGCVPVTFGQPFTFSSNATGGGTTFFQIQGDSGFSTLDIETAGTFASTSDVQCITNAFGNCTVTFLDGVTDIYLSGCIEGPCIQAGGIFDIDLDNVQCDGSDCTAPDPGTGGWGANRSFAAIGGDSPDATTPFISAPEPSGFFLLCTGGAAVALRRRLIRI